MTTQFVEPENPCVSVCDSFRNGTGICSGCFRTTEEVVKWASHKLSPEEKFIVLRLAKLRKKRNKGSKAA